MDRDRLIDLERQVDELADEMSRVPVRLASSPEGGGETVTIILGYTVNPVGEDDPLFYIDHVDLVTGTDPRDNPEDEFEAVPVLNTFSRSYTQAEKVLAIRRADDEQFETDKTGGESGGPTYIKGHSTTTAEAPANILINNITVLSGKDPREEPGDAAEIITVKNAPGIDVANGDIVWAMHDFSAGDSNSNQWTTANFADILYWLHAQDNYDSAELQVFAHKTEDEAEIPTWLNTSFINPPTY